MGGSQPFDRIEPRVILSVETIVINTGARPVKPPIGDPDDGEVHDSTDLLELDSDPASLAVVGGGYVCCEYAHMYSPLGADVTVFPRGNRLLPDEDPEVSVVIKNAFEDEGIRVQTGSPITASAETAGGVRVEKPMPSSTPCPSL